MGFMRKAVQLHSSEDYAANVDSSKELSIYEYLKAKCQQDRNFVLFLSDYFTHYGPNGKHLCVITKPMGLGISTFLNASFEEYDPLNHPTRRVSTWQGGDGGQGHKRICFAVPFSEKFKTGSRLSLISSPF